MPRPTALRFLALLTAFGLTAAACGAGHSAGNRAARPPNSTTSSTSSTSSTSTTAAPTTTTTTAPSPEVGVGVPWPVLDPAPSRHHSVLVMGDSLSGQTLWSLPWLLVLRGFDVTVYPAFINGSGLLDTMKGVSPGEYFAQQMSSHPDVDTVVFEWAGACSVACKPGGKVVFGSEEFFDQWQVVAHALMRDAKQRGLTVLWAISPPIVPAVTDAAGAGVMVGPAPATILSSFDRGYPASEGVTAIDWWQALSDTAGGWQRILWYDGRPHVVRADDGVHLTPDGSVRTATWTMRALEDAWAR